MTPTAPMIQSEHDQAAAAHGGAAEAVQEARHVRQFVA